MEATNVTLRIDRRLKDQADELFSELGLTFTAAVNLFIRKSLRTGGIPFDVDMSTTRPGRTDQAMLGEALEQLLASQDAQDRISRVHAGGPIEYGTPLAPEEIERTVEAG